MYPNEHVETITNSTWCRILQRLGRGGDLVMIDLLLDDAIFVPVGETVGLIQISGTSNYGQMALTELILILMEQDCHYPLSRWPPGL